MVRLWPTWVDAKGALDVAAPHAGGSAGDSVHVREELHGAQREGWCRAILTQVVILIALEVERDHTETDSGGIPPLLPRKRKAQLHPQTFVPELQVAWDNHRVYKVKQKNSSIGGKGHGLSGLLGTDELIPSQMAWPNLELQPLFLM